MADLKELHDKLGQLSSEARAYLDEADKATDEARKAELNELHDRAMAQYDELRSRIDRETKLAEIEEAAAAAKDLAERKAIEARRPEIPPGVSDTAEGGELSYRDAFHAYVQAGGKMSELGSEARGILEARALGSAATITGTGSANANGGGFTIPEEMREILVKSMRAWGPMYSTDRVTSLNTEGGNPMPFPTIDDTFTPAATAVDKQPEKKAENTAVGADSVAHSPRFGEKTLNAYLYSTDWVQISQELMQDSAFAMETLVGELLGERLGREANFQLTVGDGTGDPQGIVTGSTAATTVALSSSAAFTADHLIDFYHELDPAYVGSPSQAFMMNNATLAAVRKLKTSNGDYVFTPSVGGPGGQLAPDMAGTIFGVPVMINQAMVSMPSATQATGQRAILFGDLSKYYVRKVRDITLGAQQDTTNWPNVSVAGYLRLDGIVADARGILHLPFTYS